MGPLESVVGALRRCCEGFPDQRRGSNVRYDMAEVGLAAFSVFFMQSPSFLAHQRQLQTGHGRSNCGSLFGLNKIPTDNHIRAMLDPVPPALLHPVFAEVVEELERADGLRAFRRLGSSPGGHGGGPPGGGHVLIALDATEYFRSAKIHCPQCSTQTRAGGKTEYFHSMLAATLVAPGHQQVVPLEPEFIAPQDGAEKQDCESRAARRWLATHGPRYARLDPIYLGDDLFSNQPICEAVRASGGHFLFVCKPTSHKLIAEYVDGGELETLSVALKRGRQRVTHRHRWINQVPLRDGKDAMAVNWLEIEIVDPTGTVRYRNSFITDLPVDRNNVAEMAACGRARWKIENEAFNVLKTTGYNLEHNFGHGKRNLATMLVTLNLLAFACHTVCDSAEHFWKLARSKVSSRAQFFNRMQAITAYLIFSSWDDLLQTLAFAKPPPEPP